MENDLPKLIVLSGPEQGQEFSLREREVVYIGRSEENEFSLSDTSLSRRHVTLVRKDSVWYLRDENSRNGTILNDSKLLPEKESKLSNADIIKIGVYELRFLDRNVTEQDILDKTNYKKNALPTQTTEPVEIPKPVASPVQPEPVEEAENTENDKVAEGSLKIDADHADLSGGEYLSSPSGAGRGLKIFIVIALLFCLVGVGLFAQHQYRLSQGTDEVTEDDVGDVDQESQTDDEDVDKIVESQQTTAATDVKTYIPATTSTSSVTIDGTTSKVTSQPDLSNVTAVAAAATFTAALTVQMDSTPNALQQQVLQDFKALTVATTDAIVSDKPLDREFNVFLEVITEPTAATVYLESDDLGRTPFKRNVAIKPNQEYTLNADFELRELNDIYRKKVHFKAKPDSDVIELKIDAELGVLKILKLPRKVEFYLEGYYDYDKVRAKPVRLTDIVYGKPIYLPYGKYIVELREQTKIAGSDNLVNVIRYQREYKIGKDNRVLNISVTDKDLQLFPASIQSNPTGAAVYLGNDKVGETPFNDNLPLGKNKLKVVKDGYFAHVVDIDMTMNSAYKLTVDLKTSKMGELINEAKEKLRNGLAGEAIQILVDALKYGGSAREKSEVYFLLGDSYLAQKDYDQARPYFEKARESDEFFGRATIGLAKVYHAQNSPTEALKTIVEILVNLDEKSPAVLRSEANAAFRTISPVKSVMYIYTDPPGAAVFVNDKRIDQVSPLILSDLGIGNYRLQFEKAGYQTYKTKQSLKVGEFILVKVKLRPESM